MDIIRLANIEDLEAIVEIYNQAIVSGFETADTIPLSPEDKLEWFNSHIPDKYPIFVYEIDDRVVAWLSISPYRFGRRALRFTAEISYYVHTDFKGKGIGSKLVDSAIEICKRIGLKTLIAIILDKNTASIALVRKFNFEKWAELPNVADFDGIECGHVYYGLRIGE